MVRETVSYMYTLIALQQHIGEINMPRTMDVICVLLYTRLFMSYICLTYLGGWWQYESRISEEVESAFKAGEKRIEITICGELYVIDLDNNHQYQKNNPIRRRRIKRSSVKDTQKKGVAGIK